MTDSKTLPPKKVIVVGGGFSGLAMACQLKQNLRCDDFVVYDRGSGYGGTWRANTYPGCGVDIPAVLYSLSFAPNPDFTNLFPKQSEVLNYIDGVVSQLNLSRHLVGNTNWIGGYWNENTKTWSVKLRDLKTGQEYFQTCSVLISAVGALTDPMPFNAAGKDRFTGEIIHTARWDHSVSLRDKNIVVIGNGASATQVVPTIAEEARSITQFIRSPQYFLPGGGNTDITPLWQMAFRYIPGVLFLLRLLTFLYLETSTPQFNLTDTGAKMRKQTSDISTSYIKESAPEKYWPLLMPKSEVGCKRRVFDHSGYVPSLQRDNVHLTNDPVESLHERSVSTKSGTEYPADVIVLANGFSLTQFDADLRGRHGRTRTEHWKDMGYIEAFNTIGMSGFPNFFYILGPNSGRGHTSVVHSIENYAGLITRVIKPIITGSALCVEPKLQSEKVYNEKVQNALSKTVFTDSCNSWYIDSKTGRNWVVYPWSSFYMLWTTQMAGLGDWYYEVSSSALASCDTTYQRRPNC
ncbi:FAD/NAD(P)-binding domain-containing protein [Aspergillus steynii IBT 23096]|uniref:FAD/NAD(P)-binding domain-containing protein n=1 Tax=Aspergillus steynii IBT 23096 TaxID=1392250 RepID=A0A2I2G6K8_9EURO|nr:FAD/NAD(P)-binding domain-containing protein [Aspergillus steynii IBT 23096]PLB48509.1 FAD/NAD(P)-binding domain-containing protein [Aspergillus steynii IBT 23096]